MELSAKYVVTGIKQRTQAQFFKELQVGDTFEVRYFLSGYYKYAPTLKIYQDGKQVHTNNASQLAQNLQKFELTELKNTRIYTLYSYEDGEIKDVFCSKREAYLWIEENRNDRPDDVTIEEWRVLK